MESRQSKNMPNLPLRIISLFLGYTFWYICGNFHTTTAWITIPLCFYNVPIENSIKAPEFLSVKITGKRTELRSLDVKELAVHINAELLREGKNFLSITPETFFLPESIKLVHYSPSNPTVEVIRK